MSSLSHQAYNNLVRLRKKDSRIIVFIDSSIADCESIAQKVIPQARAIIIGSEDDGVIEISKILNDSGCLEIHIFSSGFPGCVYLGNSELSLNTFKTYRSLLKNWFKFSNVLNLSDSLSRIHLYSLNLNIGDVGEEFVAKLNQATGAKICTSSCILNSTIISQTG